VSETALIGDALRNCGHHTQETENALKALASLHYRLQAAEARAEKAEAERDSYVSDWQRAIRF
jgi:hypothetical protein